MKANNESYNYVTLKYALCSINHTTTIIKYINIVFTKST